MKCIRCLTVVVSFFAIMLISGFVGAQNQTVPKEEPGDQAPKTLAILPFENNSVTDPEHYAPLSKGLAAMLTTDLKNSGTTLKLIERNKIQAILKEIALSLSGSVDEATAIKAGKILGAQSIAFGSYMVLGKVVRIDTRIIKVETSELILAEMIQGNSDKFMDLEQQLAKKIANSMQVAFSPKNAKGKDINAALYFSRGLDALDQGDKNEAKRLFTKCLKLDPSFKDQVDNVQGLD